MIAIFEVENLLQAECFCNAFGVPLIVQNALAGRARPSHFIVGGTDQVACVSFADEFGDGAARKYGNIVGVGLDGGEYFAGMKSAGSGALDKNAFGDVRQRGLWRRAGLLRNVGAPRAQQGATD